MRGSASGMYASANQSFGQCLEAMQCELSVVRLLIILGGTGSMLAPAIRDCVNGLGIGNF